MIIFVINIIIVGTIDFLLINIIMIRKKEYTKPYITVLFLVPYHAFMGGSQPIRVTATTDDVDSDWQKHIDGEFYGEGEHKTPYINPFLEDG